VYMYVLCLCVYTNVNSSYAPREWRWGNKAWAHKEH
jgi:hypothetical protein